MQTTTDPDPGPSTEIEIREICQEIGDLLVEKNRSYGDSALNPKHVFSRLTAVEGIKARIDDKLARLMQGNVDAFREDPELDLMGYLILLRIAKKRAKLGDVAKHETNYRPVPPHRGG
jgi:hypothetical protein